MWRLSKEAIKPSWNTRVNGSVNPKLLEGVRVFQWRWHNSDKADMMSVTGHALKKLRLSWNGKKRRAVRRVYPVKTSGSWKWTFKIPGIFHYLFDHKIATAPQRQPHSNSKIAQPLARFSPRRDVYAQTQQVLVTDDRWYTSHRQECCGFEAHRLPMPKSASDGPLTERDKRWEGVITGGIWWDAYCFSILS